MPRLVQEFENVRTFQRKLYVKAKQEKEFRFYSLYDKIYRMDVLRYAWTKCKANKGAPGVDGRTFKSIEENEGVENFLNFLATELENGTYKSQPVRRVYIPKPDGSQRPLGIPCIKDRVAQMACLIVIEPIFDAKARFTSLAYIITSEFLMETWRMMNRKGASGVDGETTRQFESQLEERTQDIWSRMKANCYKAPPVRRVEIPKGNGKTRPLGIPTVENRLVQRAVARILEAIFEQDFLNFSYGFRPGRNPHQALQSLRSTIVTKKVRHIFEADIRGYFNHINHEWLMKMLKQRIADPVILRLVGKWLKAGVMENGVVTRNEEGTPQGGLC